MATSSMKCFLITKAILRSNSAYRSQLLYMSKHIFKPLEETQTLAEKLEEMSKPDPELDKPINIGFPLATKRRSYKQKVAVRLKNKKNTTMEKLARHQLLTVPLEEVDHDYRGELAPLHTRTLAEHYGIFRDLFDNAFFVPTTQISVGFDLDDENILPVYRGNKIPANQVTLAPGVRWSADEGSLWTLCMTAPDSHLTDNSSEVLHWMVANIPGDDMSKGEVLCNYMRPFPVKGSGWHRYVFVLYRQSRRLDMSTERRCIQHNLHERTFSSLEFYRQWQDDMTPAGLAWFQSEWDDSVTEFFHRDLDMPEPLFEYDFLEPYHPPQKIWPHKKPFQLYLDRYRDRKEIKEQVLKERLKMINPFEDEEKPFKYPNIYQMDIRTSRWIKTETEHRRNRRLKWKWLDPLQE